MELSKSLESDSFNRSEEPRSLFKFSLTQPRKQTQQLDLFMLSQSKLVSFLLHWVLMQGLFHPNSTMVCIGVPVLLLKHNGLYRGSARVLAVKIHYHVLVLCGAYEYTYSCTRGRQCTKCVDGLALYSRVLNFYIRIGKPCPSKHY